MGQGVFADGNGDLAWARVLIVDDQPANVVLLERLLRRMGVHQTHGLTDSREALDSYRSLDPDLVLLDLHMPHLDGFGVLAQLERERPDDSFVPVVVLTADATDAAKQDALGAGATDFLTKPFDTTEVALRVRNLLRTRSLHTTLQRHSADLQSELERRAALEQRLAGETAERLDRVRGVIEGDAIRMVFQPVVHLDSGDVVGVEALARFPSGRPDQWFAEAAAAGLGADLEIAAIRAALRRLAALPDGAYMALNVSPATTGDPRLAEAIRPYAAQIVVELTEHEAVDGYDALLTELDGLRELGARIAVDDAGSGYAGLQHILRVRPDVIKLDLELTRDIDLDPARRALASALVSFAGETGAAIIAEGIERAEELDTLRTLRVGYGQGFHLGRPGPLPVPSRGQATAAAPPSMRATPEADLGPTPEQHPSRSG